MMNKNSKRFVLVYQSLILLKRVLSQIGIFREMKQSQDLLCKGKLVSSINSNLSSFLQLIYNPESVKIDSRIKLDQ